MERKFDVTFGKASNSKEGTVFSLAIPAVASGLDLKLNNLDGKGLATSAEPRESGFELAELLRLDAERALGESPAGGLLKAKHEAEVGA